MVTNLVELLSFLSDVKDLHLSVFFHKSDISLTTEQQNGRDWEILTETAYQKTIQNYINERISEVDMHLSISFCRTSIYDNSIFDGISKCIQRILPRRSNVQNLLNSLSQSCNMDKVYLFDTFTKLCIAMDSSPNETGLYELCSDSIDVVFELVNIYSTLGESSDMPSMGTLGEQIAESEQLSTSSPITSSIV